MATITFFIRPTKKVKKVNVYCRFKDGRRYDFTVRTGLDVLPHYFSNDTHTINQRKNYPDKAKDKKYLRRLEETIQSAYKDLKDTPTADWLNDIIDRFRFPDKYKEKSLTFFEFIQQFIDDAPKRVISKTGRPVSLKTTQDYIKTLKDLKSFATYKSKEYDFKDINKEFYTDFIYYLTHKKTKQYPTGLSKNTIGKKIKVLKTFLNAATPKYLTSDQYKGFHTLTEESQNVYLTPDELQALNNIDLATKPRLERVRDLFLVGCWTGLRFSDWDKVTPENIKNGFIKLIQNKTGNEVVIPLHQTTKAILDKYEGKLPIPISNQKFNEYLKEVAKLAKFKEIITTQITRGGKIETVMKPKWEMIGTHTARRSFATNAYKAGIPSITIMAITGHRTETAFLKYIKVTLEEHAEKINEIWLNNANHLKVAQ